MKNNKNILITGGAGYIGSHMVRLLLKKGYQPIVFDNLSTGHRAFVPKNVPFVKGDLCNLKQIESVFRRYSINAVMHFAALAIVSESVENPILYYQNNVGGTINLIHTMLKYNVNYLIFSSTCAVYNSLSQEPLKENSEIVPTNPYGRTKAIIEKFLEDVSTMSKLRYISLRYFNVAGAIDNAEIGEKHNPETHLIPSILKSIKNKTRFYIFGKDYKTKDGTCVRDYIHVMDLCAAHYLALKYLNRTRQSDIFNLGSGKGFSVEEIIKAVEENIGNPINVVVKSRRLGDGPRLVASSQKAEKILKWKRQKNLSEMINSAWKWERRQS